jgi:hypothetical protein
VAGASSLGAGGGGRSAGGGESTLPSVSLSLAREGLSNFSTPSVWGAGKHAPVVTGPMRDTFAREGGGGRERETRQSRTRKGRQTLAEYKASVAREEAVVAASDGSGIGGGGRAGGGGEGGGDEGGMKGPKSLAAASTSVSPSVSVFVSQSLCISLSSVSVYFYASLFLRSSSPSLCVSTISVFRFCLFLSLCFSLPLSLFRFRV